MITIGDEPVALATARRVLEGPVQVTLGDARWQSIHAASRCVDEILSRGSSVYGINTGFGLLANTKIPSDQLSQLQTNLILSHAAGVGEPFDEGIVRLIIFLKVVSLSRGASGVRSEILDALLLLLEHDILPVIPSKGSVGASGDLAPLAHLAAALLGVGDVLVGGARIPARDGLKKANIAELALAPKEGLALINGTQVSTALGLAGLFMAENVFAAAIAAGALSVDALRGSDAPFDPRIHELRGHAGQIRTAAAFRDLLGGSEIRASHLTNDDRVQDPYSLRCQPQVMGACLDLMVVAAHTLATEANAVSDNPLVFSDSGEVVSGGNFHAEPVAFAADQLAIAVAEIGSISERRSALLVDPKMSGLPPFLVQNSGINSGFMIAQVTAAALVSENKQLAYPASVDSIPTSANQEDHVSMATHGARRLTDMSRNAATVVAVELLSAAQGIEFQRPLSSSPVLEEIHAFIRSEVPAWTCDRFMAPDLDAITNLVLAGELNRYSSGLLPSGGLVSDSSRREPSTATTPGQGTRPHSDGSQPLRKLSSFPGVPL